MVEAAKRYAESYEGSPAERYIEHRGLAEVASRFKLGYVASAITGHERYTGRLAIPYLRPAGGPAAVATIRFRCIADSCTKSPEGDWLEKEQHEGHGKYLGLPGDPPRIFNTAALITPSPHVGLTEGELDAMAGELAGVPTAGVPGVSAWKPHFAPAFKGFDRTLVFGDGDEAGRNFADKMSTVLENAIPCAMPDGLDVNGFVQKQGVAAFRERVGV
ncbi:topoisomerase [Streptomyces sp. ISL-11]|nr:topoisomerase [Streptomyces sp. ISL-11]